MHRTDKNARRLPLKSVSEVHPLPVRSLSGAPKKQSFAERLRSLSVKSLSGEPKPLEIKSVPKESQARAVSLSHKDPVRALTVRTLKKQETAQIFSPSEAKDFLGYVRAVRETAREWTAIAKNDGKVLSAIGLGMSVLSDDDHLDRVEDTLVYSIHKNEPVEISAEGMRKIDRLANIISILETS